MRLALLLAVLWLCSLIAAAVGISTLLDQPWAALVAGCAGVVIAHVGLWLAPRLLRAHQRRLHKD